MVQIVKRLKLRRFCFPIARSPTTDAMRTMMAMETAMICMIWSFVYATLSGSLLKVFLSLQCKITEKITKDQLLRCHLLHIALIEATYPNFIWRVLNYLVFLWRITTL